MINQLFVKYRNLILYGVIGGFSASFDFVLFLVLYNILHLNPLVSTALSTSAGITTSFLGNILFNFKVRDRMHHRYIVFYLVGISGLLLSVLIIYVLHDLLDMSANLAKLISIPIVVLTQYFINSRVSLAENFKGIPGHKKKED